jgi:TrmH family RNA methyltransferase
MGNEQKGLGDDMAEACRTLIRIPQGGEADSLNLAVATGISLYEIRRSHLELS